VPVPFDAGDETAVIRSPDVSGYVFRFVASRHAARHEGLHAVKVRFVELGEGAGIALRRLNQLPLVGLRLNCFQFVLRGTAAGISRWLSN